MQVFIKNDEKELGIQEFSTTNLNKNTKKAQHFLQLYANAVKQTIYDCYKNPSHNKITIYNKLIYFKIAIGGYNHRIISFNAQFFTLAYRVLAVDGDYLIVDTPCYRYSIKL